MSEPTKSPSVQLAFDFPHCPSFADSDFLIAPCNAEAVAWIERWPDWPTLVLALVGPAGSGKSHLASIFATRAGGLTIAPEELAGIDPIARLGDARVVVVDEPERMLGERAASEGLFHLFNRLAAIKGSLLLTGANAPSRWRVPIPDLASRLVTAAVAKIEVPDDALLASILAKLFADRQLRPSAEVVRYILARVERSPAGLSRLVAEADRRALAFNRAVTIALISDVVRDLDA